MPINFNGINPNAAGGLRPKTEGTAQSQDVAKNTSVVQNGNASTDNAATKERSDQVSFSSQARDLKQLEGSIRRLPEVDQERVAKIKAALADGSYKIDNNRLAGKLLDSEEEIS